MILGLFSLSAFTLLHVVICFAAILTGFIVMFGMIANKRLDGWTFWFLLFTVLVSVTGFGFPFDHLLPSHIVGIISLVVLLIAIIARYPFGLRGAWRWIYVIAAIAAQWFDVFVLIVQSFQKVAALHALAPTQSEPPFQITQAVVLVIFIAWAIAAVRKFHPPAA